MGVFRVGFTVHEQEEQSLNLALGHPWVWSVSDFIFLASAYELGWSVLSLTISSSHWQRTVSVLIIAELERAPVEQKSQTKFLPWPGFQPQNSRFAVQHANHRFKPPNKIFADKKLKLYENTIKFNATPYPKPSPKFLSGYTSVFVSFTCLIFGQMILIDANQVSLQYFHVSEINRPHYWTAYTYWKQVISVCLYWPAGHQSLSLLAPVSFATDLQGTSIFLYWPAVHQSFSTDLQCTSLFLYWPAGHWFLYWPAVCSSVASSDSVPPLSDSVPPSSDSVLAQIDCGCRGDKDLRHPCGQASKRQCHINLL